MNLSRERLLAQAASTGFRPEVLEKVLRLVSLLNALSSSPLVVDRTMTDVATLRQRALPLLERVLPLISAEVQFLDDINDRGVIDPALLTADDTLADRIRACPALMWKVQNVREYKGLT